MGFWNLFKNINNAEGIREAMRLSYDKHFNLAVEGKIPLLGSTPHKVALYGALGSRFRVSGVPTNNIVAEILIWADLLPFLYIPEATAREAVAEYVVYKEMPKDARISWLTNVVQQGCEVGETTANEEYHMLLLAAEATGSIRPVWLLLFEGRGNDYFWGDRW